MTDDGQVLPTPTLTWSQVSGPGTATFTAPTALTTSVSFSAAGTYVLRLSVYDGALTGSDDVTVTVNAPANLAPIVNAGADQVVTLPATATLTATVTDDGQVLPTPTLTWSQVSGPGTATFTAPTALTTSVSFSAAGTYVLRLSVYDGALTGSDDVTVTVNAPANLAPIVNAGADQVVTLPQTATLTATVTDDGQVLPTPTLTWSQVSGPGTATFTAPTALTTSVSFSAAGTYVLRLSVYDGALTGVRRRDRDGECAREPRADRQRRRGSSDHVAGDGDADGDGDG